MTAMQHHYNRLASNKSKQKSIQHWVAINSEMAATFSSVMWKILVIAVAIAALLVPSGEGKFVCQGKCEDIPDRDNWCKTAGGYPQGGSACRPSTNSAAASSSSVDLHRHGLHVG